MSESSSGEVRLTEDGKAIALALDYGHNPKAYLCVERPEFAPFQPQEVCVHCSDGLEAFIWKRRALEAKAAIERVSALADDWEAERSALHPVYSWSPAQFAAELRGRLNPERTQ